MLKFLRAYINHPENTSFDGEDFDEDILLLLRKAVVTNLGWIFATALIVVVPLPFGILINFAVAGPINLNPSIYFILLSFWYLFGFGYAFLNFINWFFSVYIVTTKRIVDVDFHGLLYKNQAEAPLRNIEDVTYSIVGTTQVLFNYGDVNIQTAAENREFDFSKVPNPARVADIISDLVSQERDHGA